MGRQIDGRPRDTETKLKIFESERHHNSEAASMDGQKWRANADVHSTHGRTSFE